MRKRVLRPKTVSDAPMPADEFKGWRRDELGWTQHAAAQWLGVSLKTYQNWEQAYRSARHPVAMRRLMDQARRKRA